MSIEKSTFAGGSDLRVEGKKRQKEAAQKYFKEEYKKDQGSAGSEKEYVEAEMLSAELDEEDNIRMEARRREDVLKKKLATTEEDLLHGDSLLEESVAMINAEKQAVAKWKEKWQQDRIDNVTGLEIRKVLFERMNDRIKDIYSFDENTTREDIFEMLVKKSPKDFGKKDFSVMMADVSFLSLVNEAGHEQGDTLLKQIGAEVKKEVADSYRHGGDEITGFFDEQSGVFDIDSSDFKEKITKMRESIKKLPIEKINEYQLKPNLDVGVASFKEALSVFRDLAKNPEVSDKLKAKPVKKLENIMVAIADKRSFIEKGKERISLLSEKYDNKKVYNQIISFLRKGGHGISDKKVKEIANIAKGKLPERIMKFFKQLAGTEDSKLKGQDKRKVDKSVESAIARFITEKEQAELYKLKEAEDKYPYYESLAIMKIIEI